MLSTTMEPEGRRRRGEAATESLMIKSMKSQRPNSKIAKMRRHTILRFQAPAVYDLNYKKLILIVSIGAVGNWAILLSSAVSTSSPSSSQSRAAAANDITLTRRNESAVVNASLASLNSLTRFPIKLETTSPIDAQDSFMTRISTGAPPSKQPSDESSDKPDATKHKPDDEDNQPSSKKISSFTIYEPSASYATVSHVSGSNDDFNRVHDSSTSETNADVGTRMISISNNEQNHSYRVSDAMLHREHHHHYHQHQPNASQRQMRDESGSSNDTSRIRDDYGNHSINSKIKSDASNHYQRHIPNHNYGPMAESSNHHSVSSHERNSSNSFFNAELIQNLTASLFPKRNLSNATLHSLSELLNKTRQIQQQQQQQQQVSKYEPPVYYQPSSRQQHISYSNNNSTHGRQSIGNRNLDALLNEHTYGLLGFLNPENNRFGFRDNSYNHQQSLVASAPPNKQQYPLYEGPKPKHVSSKSDMLYAKTPSNIYNTYLPYAGGSTSAVAANAAASSLSQSAPMIMTNGQQALNFALYQSLLNEDISKWSSKKNNEFHDSNNSEHSIPNNNALRSMLNSITDSAFAPTGSQTMNGYHYTQQQNTNNQNHLDRLTYHSTPFRPTIASPSSSFQATMGSNQQVSSHNRSKYLDPTRLPINGYPNALGSVQSSATEQQPNSSGANSGRIKEIPGQQQGNYSAGSRVVVSGLNETNDHPMTSDLRFKNQSASSQLTSNNNYSQAYGQQQQQQQPTTIHSGAPAILFELYEREIDNQIREAIYADHQQHHSHLSPALLNIAASNNQWLTASEAASNQVVPNGLLSEDIASSSNIAVPFSDKPPLSHSFLPRPLSTALPAYSYAADQSTFPYYPRQPSSPFSNQPMQQSASSTVPQPDNTLAAALQELPTFTAADLQPLIPFGRPTATSISGLPEYSMLSVSHQKPEPTYSESSPSLFASTDNWLNLNQNDFYTPSRIPFVDTSLLASEAHLKANTNPPATSGQGSITSSLSSMLLKLQPGPLTSILASPFAHLYASLPRYRYGKKHQPNSSSPGGAASTSSASFLNPLIGHSSLRGLWQMLGNGTASNDIVVRDSATGGSSVYSKDQNGLYTKPNGYQSKRLAAITAANLIAASNGGQTVDPIHLLALIQAQTNLMAAQSPNAVSNNDLAGLASSESSSRVNPYLSTTSMLDSNINSLDNPVSHSDPAESQWIANGMTPQTWQSIQSAMQWNKKWQQHQPQTHAAASYSNLYESLTKPALSVKPVGNGAGFNSRLNKSNPTSSLFGRQITTPLGLLLGGASTPLSHLLSPQLPLSSGQGNTASITPAPTETSSSKVLPARLKIKILKVPVAVYDTAGSNSVGQPTGSDNLNLLPTNLHTALASLHANLPCAALHQQQAAASAAAGKPLTAASTNAPGALHSSINNPLHYLSSPLTPIMPIKLANRDNDDLLASLASHMNLESPKPATAQIQSFTDINQPTDLQVAPTFLQHQNKSII